MRRTPLSIYRKERPTRLSPLLVCTTLVILALPAASQAGNGPGRCKKYGKLIEWSGTTNPHLLRDFAAAGEMLREAGYDQVARFANRQVSFDPIDSAIPPEG